MNYSIITIHPPVAEAVFADGLLKKAVERGLVSKTIYNLRDYSQLSHRRVDDQPYGGGPGMVLRPEPLVSAITEAKTACPKAKVIALSAKGERFHQTKAVEFSKCEGLIFVCGRYEGIDQRVIDHYVDEEISIGDYVLMGGELAAGVLIEAISRNIPGVLGNAASLEIESHSVSEPTVEYPHYTRPEEFLGHRVPEVLLSGDHEAIKKWRGQSS